MAKATLPETAVGTKDEHLWQLFAEAVPQIVWTARPDGWLDYYNGRWVEYTGLTLEQTQGWGWGPVLHPDDLQTCVDLWTRSVETGEPYEVEYRFRRASDGSYRWHLGRALPVRGGDGRIIRWFGTCTDIDDQKRAQEALRAAHERLDYHVSNTPLVVVEWDHEFRVLRWSMQAERTFGWRADEVLGKHPSDWRFVYEGDVAAIEDVMSRLLSGKESSNVGRNRNYARDGRVVHCEWHNSVLLDSEGRLVSILSLTQDVTERAATEARLRSSQRELEAQKLALDEHAIVSVADRAGRMTYVNDKFCEISGYSRDELLGRDHRVVNSASHPKTFFAGLWRTIATGGTWKGEVTNRRKDGSLYVVDSTIVPFLDDEGRPYQYVSIRTDVTHLKMAERELRALNETLEARVAEGTAELRAASDALRESEQRFRAVFERSPDAIVLMDPHNENAPWAIVDCNDAFCQHNGYRRDELLGRSIDLLNETELRKATGAVALERMRREGAIVGEGIHRRKDGTLFPIEYATSIVSVDGREHVLGVDRDVTEARAGRAALRASEEQFRSAVEHSPIGMALVGLDGRWLRVNRALCNMSGYAEPELLASSFQAITHPDDLDADRDHLRRLMAGETEFYEMEKRYVHRDGHAVRAHLSVSLVRDADGRPLHFVSQVQDVTERRQVEERVSFLAFHDSLTGLPNRTLFRDRLEQALSHAGRHGQRVAVGFVDLDRFKLVNDTLGHAVGDALLQEVARRLSDCIRSSDTACRVSGDEFTLIFTGVEGADVANQLGRKLVSALAVPVRALGHEVDVSASVGIATFPDDAADAETLLRAADAAMYGAKAAGRNAHRAYSPDLGVAASERGEVERHLRGAIERNELELYYQPIFGPHGTPTRLEALMRWTSPALGVVAPSKFIPVAEDAGLIGAMGTWVLERACAQNAAWQRAGLLPVKIAVNVSAVQFASTDLAGIVERCLAAAGLEPRWLELELTETLVMQNPDDTLRRMARLKALGVSLSIDDFGTGYSSLSRLHRLPIDLLKVDGSLVREVDEPFGTLPLVKAVVEMAHALGLEVVAEGVETDSQLAAVRELGCEHVQGYLLGRPMPAAESSALLGAPGATEQIPCLRPVGSAPGENLRP